MHAAWTIDDGSLAQWRQLVADYVERALPRRRYELNVRRVGIDLSKRNVWRVLVGCQVTTQQRSGPNSAASRFMNSASPALSPGKCRDSDDLCTFLEEQLSNAGLRRAPTIANNLTEIWNHLEQGEWKTLLAHLETLRAYPTLLKERAVVSYLLEGKYSGLGQKQSRNFIQWIGVSRYEVPLDSRVLKKLKEFGANFVPSGTALSDETVYLFLQDVLHRVSRALEIYPCMLDACIFASFDVEDDAQGGDDA